MSLTFEILTALCFWFLDEITHC